LARFVRNEFDPQAFLAKVGEGKTVSTFHKNETVFEQGEAADNGSIPKQTGWTECRNFE
jgi:hypothetical protein